MSEIEKAREAFLNLIADAVTWEVDEDADSDSNRRYVDLTTFKIVTRRQQLEELVEALGIRRAYDECVGDAIDRAVEAPAVPANG